MRECTGAAALLVASFGLGCSFGSAEGGAPSFALGEGAGNDKTQDFEPHDADEEFTGFGEGFMSSSLLGGAGGELEGSGGSGSTLCANVA
jgi:hypothetical protein